MVYDFSFMITIMIVIHTVICFFRIFLRTILGPDIRWMFGLIFVAVLLSGIREISSEYFPGFRLKAIYLDAGILRCRISAS